MESPCTRNGCGNCGDCEGRFVCYCLGVTEEDAVQAITRLGLRTLDDLRQQTGAGDGCTACHRRLHLLIHRHAQPAAACAS